MADGPEQCEADRIEQAEAQRERTERQERIERDYVGALLDKRYGLSVPQPDVFDRWLDKL